MKKLLASTCLVFGLLGGAVAANAAECGSPTIASMNWQSAEVLSNIDKIILNEGTAMVIAVEAQRSKLRLVIETAREVWGD